MFRPVWDGDAGIAPVRAGRQEPLQRRGRGSAARAQLVTKHGRPAVVVIDAAEYARLKHLETLAAPSFSERLLSMPTDDGDFERLSGELREVEIR